MSALSSQFKIKQYDGFGGSFVDSDYLAAAYDTGKPHVFDNIFRMVYTAMNRFSDKPLLAMTRGAGNKIEIDDEIYRWYLQGSEEKDLTVVENLESTNVAPGVGGTTFRIKLDEDWVSAPEVLMGENNEYSLRIVDGPIPDGNGYIYEVRLSDDDEARFFPPELLEVGKRFCKAWTEIQSEFNSEFGGQYYSSSYMLESQVGAFGQEFMITDKALRQEGRIGIKLMDKSGKQLNRFLPMAEMKMYDELEMSKELALMYGRRSTKPGKDGYWIKTGPGLRQQLADGHTQVFNSVLTESLLKDYLMDIFFSRNSEDNRKVTIMTGTMGAIMFHDLLAASASAFLKVDSEHYIRKIGSNPTHLSFGAEFTHYQGPQGIEVDLVKNPQYDNPKYCKRMHPIEVNRPIDSWRMTIMDFAAPKGTSFGSNVNYLEVKNTYSHGYIPGTVGPNGPIQGGMAVKKVAGYERWVQGTAGIMVVDTSRTGELIFDFED